MRRYNPKEIEPKWQKIWRESDFYKVDMNRSADKFYIIPMLPYPSGDLHIGHWYNFAPTDTVARWRRMLGNNVMTTIGFDAFGLPAENAAIQRGIQPAKWTHQNIATMTKQIEQIGASYDWSHTLSTCDPNFYKWNQWLFLKLYERHLAYQAKAVVNWCPKDQTVLANEQVIGENNVCERCGTPVIQKEMKSWYFKITDYADQLLDDLETVDWPDKVKHMQVNWIGKSQGALIDFKVDGHQEKIQVFTTRPDTIYGATYMVLAPEHPAVALITSSGQKAKVEAYVKESGRKTELERKEDAKHKTGVFTGAYAINPASKEKIPIWIADYVLMDYGTGAIMAVPAHDERDGDFAKKFDLPIKQVVAQRFIHDANPHRQDKDTISRNIVVCIIKHPDDNKYLVVRPEGSDFWSPLIGGIEKGETAESTARRELIEETGFSDIKLLKVSDQIIVSEFFAQHKNVNRIAYGQAIYIELASLRREKASHSDELAELKWVNQVEFEKPTLGAGTAEFMKLALGKEEGFTGEGRLINSGEYSGRLSEEVRSQIAQTLGKGQTQYRLRDWLISRQRYWGTPIPIIYCDKCGAVPVPEKDLPVILPEDVEFELSGRSPLLERPDFVNTKCPKCGNDAKRETDTMDTFVDSSWYFIRYLDSHDNKAAFNPELINQWMPMDHYIGGIEHAILHLLYARFITKFLRDHHGLKFDEPFKKLTNQGIILGPDGLKMSKRRGNVVNPDDQVTSYGTDSLRLYLMFMGPYDEGGPYSLTGIAGTRRFLDRVWTLLGEFLESPAKPHSNVNETAIVAAIHRCIKKVTADLEKLSFNTAIAAMMALVNELYKIKAADGMAKTPAWQQAFENLTQLLAPFAPHISEEIWRELGHKESIHLSPWPTWDEKMIAEEMMTLAVQVNGKVRAEIVVTADASEKDIIQTAKEEPKVAELLKDSKVGKEIYVAGRLVSLVVS